MKNLTTEFLSIQTRLEKYYQSEINLELDLNDDMVDLIHDKEMKEYLRAGSSAIEIIAKYMAVTGKTEIENILDIPCGHGRVMRHLANFFPDSNIVACDLYPDRVDFCKKTFNVEGVLSRENPDEIHFENKFDLIWCGSLLTHLPQNTFHKMLDLIIRSLNDNGIAIITLLGRFAVYRQQIGFSHYVADDSFTVAESEFNKNGFGYVDYNLPDRFHLQDSYGIVFVKPSYVLRAAEKNPDIRIVGYSERLWDNHQDVLVIGKPSAFDFDIKLVEKAKKNKANKFLEASQQQILLPTEAQELEITYNIEKIEYDNNIIEISGWAFIKDHGSEYNTTYIVLQSAEFTYVYDASIIERLDVAKHFQSSNLANSGFNSRINATNIKKNTYKVGIYIEFNRNPSTQDKGKSLSISNKDVILTHGFLYYKALKIYRALRLPGKYYIKRALLIPHGFFKKLRNKTDLKTK